MRKLSLDEAPPFKGRKHADYIVEDRGVIVVVEEVWGKARNYDLS